MQFISNLHALTSKLVSYHVGPSTWLPAWPATWTGTTIIPAQQLRTVPFDVALLATVIADHTFCCTKCHWCWPFVSQVVVLGHLLPRNRSCITTTLLLSSGTVIVPKLRWRREKPVIYRVGPRLATNITILLVLPPRLLWYGVILGERLISMFSHLNQTLKSVGQVHQHL